MKLQNTEYAVIRHWRPEWKERAALRGVCQNLPRQPEAPKPNTHCHKAGALPMESHFPAVCCSLQVLLSLQLDEKPYQENKYLTEQWLCIYGVAHTSFQKLLEKPPFSLLR